MDYYVKKSILNLRISIGSADVSLHKKNLYLTFCEGRMEIEHMVPAVVVVMASSVFAMLAFVPDIRKLAHGRGFLPVDLLQESGIHRPAIPALPPGIHLDGFGDLALMGSHDVHQVADGLGCMPFCSDVDMDSCPPGPHRSSSRLSGGPSPAPAEAPCPRRSGSA